MLELIIKIDCEKTEKCFNSLCAMTGQTPEKQIKELFDLNEDLINIAKEITEDHQTQIKDMFGENVLNGLMGILS